MNKFAFFILLFIVFPAFGQTGTGSFAFEKADRDLIGVVTDNRQVYLGWRLLHDDPPDVGFNVYRITASGMQFFTTGE